MNINELIKKAHDNAKLKGFYDCHTCGGQGGFQINDETGQICPKCEGSGKADKNIGELLMLVVFELGEALEAHRHGTYPLYEMFQSEIDDDRPFDLAFKDHIKDTLHDKLADAVIRIADMCGYLGIDLERHIELKMKYNETREYKHGKKY